MDQRDAEPLRRDRAGNFDLDPVHPERATARPVDPGEDFGEGRLAGAVLAEQRVNFAGHQIEIDVAQDFDAGKLLADAARRNQRLTRAHPRRFGHGASDRCMMPWPVTPAPARRDR
jgi:hypothetical protein